VRSALKTGVALPTRIGPAMSIKWPSKMPLSLVQCYKRGVGRGAHEVFNDRGLNK